MRIPLLAAAFTLLASPTGAALYTMGGGQIEFRTTGVSQDIILNFHCNQFPAFNDKLRLADGSPLCPGEEADFPETSGSMPLTLLGVGAFASYYGNDATNAPSIYGDFDVYAVSIDDGAVLWDGLQRFTCFTQASGPPVCDTRWSFELYLLDLIDGGFIDVTGDYASWTRVAEVPLPSAIWLMLAGLTAFGLKRRSAH